MDTHAAVGSMIWIMWPCAPRVLAAAYTAELWVSGGLFSAAFAIFALVYFPVLSTPRIDGPPG